ncbi:MAG: tetratricopeptide repeat protein [Candidatus Thorarchaeota archaeon]|jgi:tetratricopeptide (TPR) repeat protein
MYERFEPSDRVFVDREEYLDWMSEALERCKERSVVLHLRGIGGIGKSSLLDHWKSTIDDTIRVDCEQYTDFYARMNVIAKGAVLLGVNLRRFDVLWQIRQRFVEGVEPVKEKGREWAKEVVMAIPFIGSLASIGSAIGAIGAKVSPRIKGRYGELGDWLQTRLGKDYIQRLLEILWKEPRHAEFLYLDALLEDLNNRKTSETPIVFLLDHSEHVDDERCRWRYGGREISETELWYVFLTSLSNCVGVMASRHALPSKTSEELDVEESELTELDRESCIDLLEQRGVTDRELQEKIVSVSGGNPFVIGAICDVEESERLSLSDVEDLQADTLEAVRLKTWRRLFSKAQDLLQLAEKAGLVPFFDRRTMSIIAPDMRTDHWDRLIRLSFVRDRGNGTWVLHDLARELIVAELGQRLQESTDKVAELLERASTDESDYTLLGLAVSVRALSAERDAAAELGSIVFDLIWKYDFSDALALLDAARIDTKKGHAVLHGLRGGVLANMYRVADGEHALREALERIQEFDERTPDELLVHAARTLDSQAFLLHWTGRTSEAEESYRESLKIYRALDETTLGFRPQDMAWVLFKLGWLLMSVNRLEEGEKATREALQLYEASTPTASYDPTRGITICLRNIATALFLTGRTSESEGTQRQVLGICREFASGSPDNLPGVRDLGVSLINFGLFLRATSRPYEAIDLYQEGVQLWRELGKKKPEAFLAGLPYILSAMALPLRQTDRYSEAEEAYLEALGIYRELAEKKPDVFSRHVAFVLHDRAVLLRQTGRTSEAEEGCREALRIHRELAAKSPDKYDHIVSWNLNNLAVLLRQTGRVLEAENALLEALEIRRQLAQRSPELFLHRVATTLDNLGVLLSETGKASEAEGALREALQLRRELFEKSPDLYQPGVGSTLNNLAILLKRNGRTSESENTYLEATDIEEELVLKAPTVHHHELVRVLCNYALLLSDVDNIDALQMTMARLKELGVESLPESEEWSEEEEEVADVPGAV